MEGVDVRRKKYVSMVRGSGEKANESIVGLG
jgi:hypothetical protein